MLWWLLLIPGLLLLLIVYMLFVPLVIEVNSIEETFSIRLHSLAKGGIGLEEDFITLYWSVPFYSGKFRLFEKRFPSSEKKDKDRPVKKTATRKKRKVPLRKMLAVLKSFRVRFFYMTIDTGDNMTNGILYPAVFMLSQKSGLDISINFSKENELIFIIKNNMARMLWAFIRH